MMNQYESFDYRLKNGVYIVSGPSNAGKTWLIKNICEQYSYFLTPFEHKPPSTVALVYVTYQPVYTELLNAFPESTKRKLYQNLDTTLSDGTAFEGDGYSILIIDDAHQLIEDKNARMILTRIATQTSYHSKVLVFIVLQNFFDGTNSLTTIRRNSRGIFILPYASDSLSTVLQRDYFQGRSRVVAEALEHAKKVGHRFIFVDCTADLKYRLRVGLGPLEKSLVLQLR